MNQTVMHVHTLMQYFASCTSTSCVPTLGTLHKSISFLYPEKMLWEGDKGLGCRGQELLLLPRPRLRPSSFAEGI